MNKELGAFKGNKQQKLFYVNRMIAHGKADEICQGKMWKDGKGGFIGCAFHNYDHFKFQSELNAPVWLAKLADKLFEGQENKDAQKFAITFFKKLQVGTTEKQFKIIKWKFLLNICQNVIKLIPVSLSDERKEQIKRANLGVQKVLKDAIKKGDINETDRAAAAAAAAAAAYAYAYADADAAAAAAAAAAYAYAYADADADAYADADADAYADAAAYAAAYAAAAAAAYAYAAYADARQKSFKKYADYLLKLLETKGKA